MTLFYFLMTTVFSVKPVVRTRESGTSMIYSGSGSHPVSKFEFFFFYLLLIKNKNLTSAIFYFTQYCKPESISINLERNFVKFICFFILAGSGTNYSGTGKKFRLRQDPDLQPWLITTHTVRKTSTDLSLGGRLLTSESGFSVRLPTNSAISPARLSHDSSTSGRKDGVLMRSPTCESFLMFDRYVQRGTICPTLPP